VFLNLDLGGHWVPPYTAGNDVKIVDVYFYDEP